LNAEDAKGAKFREGDVPGLRSRSPAGMTERKATAKARAEMIVGIGKGQPKPPFPQGRMEQTSL